MFEIRLCIVCWIECNSGQGYVYVWVVVHFSLHFFQSCVCEKEEIVGVTLAWVLVAFNRKTKRVFGLKFME